MRSPLQTPLLCTAALWLSCSAAAQSNFDLNEGSASFALRGDLAPTSAGWLTQRYPASIFRSIGQTVDQTTGATVGRLEGYTVVVQDQGPTAASAVSFGIFAEDSNNPGNPDPAVDPVTGSPTPAALLGPLGLPATGTGPVAYLLTVSLQTPADVIPADGDLFVGIRLPLTLTWPNTGLAVQGNAYGFGGSNAPGPNPRALAAGQVDVTAHAIDETAGNTVSNPRPDLYLRLGVTTGGATLRVGSRMAGGPVFGGFLGYGLTGIYPDHAVRQDGLALQVQDASLGTAPGAMAAVCFYWADQNASPFPTTGLQLPGLEGQLWIDAARSFTDGDVFPLALLSGGDGLFESILIDPQALPSYMAYGRFTAQGYIYDPSSGRLKLTNATIMRSL